MSTILTDDELPPMPDGTHPQSMLGQMLRKYADAREAAVLAKLAQQEPVAMRYDFDGYGYQYIDSGSGSDWRTRIPDAEAVYAAPQQADRQRVPEGYVQERKSAAQLAEELARQMYRQHPTYRGVTPLLWENAPSEVRAEWVQKASAMLAAAPEAPAQASAVDERAEFEAWYVNSDGLGVSSAWGAWQARAALAQKGAA